MTAKKENIVSRLARIQNRLNAPKNQKNNFGKYSYRSCEDILQAIKPLMMDEGCAMIISDKIVEVGDRVYVEATCSFSDGSDSVTTTAYARESLVKKGMDESQITGSTSSYARKYALNGMFAIDDCKDADTMDNRAQLTSQPAPPKIDIKPVIKIQKPTDSVHNSSTQQEQTKGFEEAERVEQVEHQDGEYAPGALLKHTKKIIKGYMTVYGLEQKQITNWVRGEFGQTLSSMNDRQLTAVLLGLKTKYLPSVGAIDIGGIAGKEV